MKRKKVEEKKKEEKESIPPPPATSSVIHFTFAGSGKKVSFLSFLPFPVRDTTWEKSVRVCTCM